MRRFCDERQSLQKSCTLADWTMELLNLAKDRLANRYVGRRGARVYAVRERALGENSGARCSTRICACSSTSRARRARRQASAPERSTHSTLCMRLALVDALFTKEQPFLLLDDPFVNLDDARTKRALELLQRRFRSSGRSLLVCNSARV